MKPKFTQKSIRRYINQSIENLERILIDRLTQIGEQFVIDARSTNTYKDQTGNLRHSIGYIVLKDGQTIIGNFDADGIGSNRAKAVTKELANDFKTGYALIVVAGMNYAAYVEAKGYDVITGSSLTAEAELKRTLNKIRKRK